MKQKKLIHRSIAYYRRYYKLIAAAVVITVTVICGSLLVGDSVRTTLERRVSERLGDAETFIVSSNSFLSQKILDTPLLKGKAQGFRSLRRARTRQVALGRQRRLLAAPPTSKEPVWPERGSSPWIRGFDSFTLPSALPFAFPITDGCSSSIAALPRPMSTVARARWRTCFWSQAPFVRHTGANPRGRTPNPV